MLTILYFLFDKVCDIIEDSSKPKNIQNIEMLKFPKNIQKSTKKDSIIL
jgi:hypothetical protein